MCEREITFSIIVPVYNKEKYLAKTIQSIIDNTYKNWELILVDDGSVDQSAQICDEFAKQDERIRVIHQKNKGVCAARNYGIELAVGEYISFIDADDFVDEQTYEESQRVIEKYQPDLVGWGWKYINGLGEVTYNNHEIEKDTLLDKEYINSMVMPPLLNLTQDKKYFIYDFTCNKIFKTQVIRENKIKFDERRKKWEDRPFLVEFLYYAQNILFLDECLYNYVGVPNSLSGQYEDKIFSIILWNYDQYKRLYGTMYDFGNTDSNNYWMNCIHNNIITQLKFEKHRDEVIKEVKTTLEKDTVKEWYKKATILSNEQMIIRNLLEEDRREDVIQEYIKLSDMTKNKKSFVQKIKKYISKIH